MTPKEQLKAKFYDLTVGLEDCFDNPIFHGILVDALLKAVDEILEKPLVIKFTPSDDQIEELKKSFREGAASITSQWAYGDPSIGTCPTCRNHDHSPMENNT